MELETNYHIIQSATFIFAAIAMAKFGDEKGQHLAKLMFVDAQGFLEVAEHNFVQTRQHSESVLTPRVKEMHCPLHLALRILGKTFVT